METSTKQMPHVALCVPHANVMIPGEFAKSLFWFGKYLDDDLNIELHTIYCQPIERARNMMVASLLKADKYTHIVFLDDDIIVKPGFIRDLILADKDIIGIWCPLKRASVTSNVWPDVKVTDYSEPVEVDEIGMGCVAVKTDVFLDMAQGFDIDKVDWFKWAGELNNAVGEDIYFCRRAKVFGFKIYMHPFHKAEHLGLAAFTESGLKGINHVGEKMIQQNGGKIDGTKYKIKQ